MSLVLEPSRRACAACARAKRKCSKESPRCRRCQERGLDCAYIENTDPFITLVPELPKAASASHAQFLPNTPDSGTEIFQENALEADWALDTLALTTCLATPDPRACSIWFLKPETWEVRQLSQRIRLGLSSLPTSMLKQYQNPLKSWLLQWVMDGSCPFIHRELYRYRLPVHIQDAYTSVLMYFNKTHANEDTVFRILEDRARRLTQDSNRPLDTFDFLSRVQALCVYQTLGIFSKDLRLQFRAEQRFPLLIEWANDMVQSGAGTTHLGSFVSQMTTDRDGSISMAKYNPAPDTIVEDALWRAWILAESVRRTHAIATGLHGLYVMIKQGEMICGGGNMSTVRKGVWDAPSAVPWARLCSEMNVFFMHREDTEALFTDAKPDEVDIYGKIMMALTYGKERMEQWGVGFEC